MWVGKGLFNISADPDLGRCCECGIFLSLKCGPAGRTCFYNNPSASCLALPFLQEVCDPGLGPTAGPCTWWSPFCGGSWALVGCSCWQWYQNSCSKCWKSHRNCCTWRTGTPPSLHECYIFYMYFLKGTNWLKWMNVSSGCTGSVTTLISLHILPNAAERSGPCEDWDWSSAVPQLHIFIDHSGWEGHTNLSMTPQPFLAYSEFPEPAAFS